MIYIQLPQIASTNSYLLDLLDKGEDFLEGTVFYTPVQTSGRGQIGNTWESEPYKNIAFSLLLKPDFLPIREQFVISELVSLAIVQVLNRTLPGFCIKWPNDIYHDDRKIAGILIETRLVGSKFKHCIIGVGININQCLFKGSAPNPVSLKMLLTESGIDQELNPEIVMREIILEISRQYKALRQGAAQTIHSQYKNSLYRGIGFHPYIDATTGEAFSARIDHVEPTGHLCLSTADGTIRRYIFKEVKFSLPCGVVKE